MSCDANAIKINPVNVFWQVEASDCWDFTGSTASGLGGKYILLSSPTVDYYVWWDENNTDTDPAVAGRTAIPVDYAASASLATIVTATTAAIEAVAGLTATSSGFGVTVVRDDIGAVTASTVGTTTTVVLSVTRKGKNFDLGLLEGDIEPSMTPAVLDIKAHQFGPTPIASLTQGFDKIECKTVMLETSKSNLKEIYSIYGGSFTPSLGTEIFGAGSASIGRNILTEAARLVLRPVNAADNTTDTVIMLCIPVPDSLKFSGENPQTLSITWKGFLDTSANSNYNALAFGDVFQPGA